MKKMKLDIQLFGATCTIGTISETTNIDTNQSSFSIPATLATDKYSYNSSANMTMEWKYASSSSWTSLGKKTFNLSKSDSETKTWSLTLTHNDDGSLENVQFRVKWYVSDSTNGTTGAKTYTPTYIPRKSDIQSITSGTTNYAPALKWTPASSSFKFIIRYLYGSWTYQTDWITPNSTAQQTFNSYTITGSSIAPYMTSSTTAQVLASLYTYTSDGHLVGDSNVYFNVTLNGNIVPSVSFTNVSEAGDVPSSWGIYVKTKSRVALSLGASGIYGSTITGYRISYYGGAVTTASATTSYIQNTGNITFTGQVTDTRGRSASTTTTINVVDYSNPTISTAQVQRCDANGNIDNNGEYMYISYGASISSCSNKNTPSAIYKVGYRVHNTGTYQYVPLTTNANSYSASGMLFSDGIKAASSSGTKVQFSTSNTYDIQFYVKDYFMEYTNVQPLDTGFDLINFNPSGKAMAIGKVSEAGANEELFEVGIPTDLQDLKSIKTNNTAGYKTDIYGNLQHQRYNVTDNMQFKNNNGDIKAQYNWENGHLSIGGNFECGNLSAQQLTSRSYMGTSSIEISSTTPYIDFHHNSSTSDYTSRIIEHDAGILTMANSLVISKDLNIIKALKGFKAENPPQGMNQYSVTLDGSMFNNSSVLGAVLIVVGGWTQSQSSQSSLFLLSWSGYSMSFSALNTIVQGHGGCSLTRNNDGTITLDIYGNGYNMISLF